MCVQLVQPRGDGTKDGLTAVWCVTLRVLGKTYTNVSIEYSSVVKFEAPVSS